MNNIDMNRQGYIYIYIYIYIEESIFRQQLIIQASFIKGDRALLFLILFFRDSLKFFTCQDLDGKGIVPYLLPKRIRPYFWSSSEVV